MDGDFILVWEESIDEIIREIIDDILELAVLQNGGTSLSDDKLAIKEEEEEYGEGKAETKKENTSVEAVKEEDKVIDVDTSVEYEEEEGEIKEDVDASGDVGPVKISDDGIEEEGEIKDVDASGDVGPLEIPDEGIDVSYVEPTSDTISPIKIVKKEWLLGILKKPESPSAPRESTCDAWAEESPSMKRVFSLSGFTPRGGHFTKRMVDREKNKIIEWIAALGGTIVGGEAWSADITHIVTFCTDDMGNMTEKVMCGLASGSAWIVTSNYVRQSQRAGGWLSPQKYAWNKRATQRRKQYIMEGPFTGQLFFGMKAVFLMKDEKAEEFYKKLVRAGGGIVASQYRSIEDLLKDASSPFLPRIVTHIFLDDVKEWAKSAQFRQLVRKTKGTTMKYWLYRSLVDLVSGKDDYLPYFNVEDYFPIRVPYVERSLKRTMWDRVDPSGIPCKVRKSEDVRRKRNPERPVVVFNPGWIDNLD